MELLQTPLQDLLVIEPRVFGDERGFFLESWNKTSFADAGLHMEFVQDNHSLSKQGILRGLHYQTKHTQGKLVRVIQGEVFDVAVDLRQDSPSFGQWYGLLLSAERKNMLWVPEGFAHGFYVTSESAEFVYKCTQPYDPDSEISLSWDDPTLDIDWPLVNGEQPILSDKDAQGLSFQDAPKF